jgi:hypothetical protein
MPHSWRSGPAPRRPGTRGLRLVTVQDSTELGRCSARLPVAPIADASWTRPRGRALHVLCRQVAATKATGGFGKPRLLASAPSRDSFVSRETVTHLLTAIGGDRPHAPRRAKSPLRMRGLTAVLMADDDRLRLIARPSLRTAMAILSSSASTDMEPVASVVRAEANRRRGRHHD